MATQVIFIPGKIMWAKGLKTPDPKYGHYSCPLIVSAEYRDKLKSMGSEAIFKDVDGGFSFKIKRDSKKMIKDKLVEFDPPKVFSTNPIGQDIELDPLTVGNGSGVTVKLSVYDTSHGKKGTRLEGVRVDELIEFKPDQVVETDAVPF